VLQPNVRLTFGYNRVDIKFYNKTNDYTVELDDNIIHYNTAENLDFTSRKQAYHSTGLTYDNTV